MAGIRGLDSVDVDAALVSTHRLERNPDQTGSEVALGDDEDLGGSRSAGTGRGGSGKDAVASLNGLFGFLSSFRLQLLLFGRTNLHVFIRHNHYDGCLRGGML